MPREGKVPEFSPEVYCELRRLAAAYLRRERSSHTLQATAVVHEAFLRLSEQTGVHWRDKSHLVALTARIMRQVLIDHAREHKAAKRGGGLEKIALNDAAELAGESPEELVALDDALRDLAALDPEKVEIVELHFFGGLTLDEIAETVGISRRTAARQMKRARAWLYRALHQGGLGDEPAALPSS